MICSLDCSKSSDYGNSELSKVRDSQLPTKKIHLNAMIMKLQGMKSLPNKIIFTKKI